MLTVHETESLSADAQRDNRPSSFGCSKARFTCIGTGIPAVLLREQYSIRDYFQPLGLSLLIDEAKCARLPETTGKRSRRIRSEPPRLINRRNLSFFQTLLLVSLRKRLAEHDSEERPLA